MYSYGVILWELVTQKIPWENLNSIQVFLFPVILYLFPFSFFVSSYKANNVLLDFG